MPILLTLLMLLLVPTRSPAQETPSSKTSPEMYGLESGKSSPNELVAELLDAVVDESQKAAEKGFNEGYRQGLLDGQPSAAWWESFYRSMNESWANAKPGLTWGTVTMAAGAGLLVGISITGILAIVFMGQ